MSEDKSGNFLDKWSQQYQGVYNAFFNQYRSNGLSISEANDEAFKDTFLLYMNQYFPLLVRSFEDLLNGIFH